MAFSIGIITSAAASSSPNKGGSFKVNSDSSYTYYSNFPNGTYTLTAVAKEGWKFKRWDIKVNDKNGRVTDKSVKFTVDAGSASIFIGSFYCHFETTLKYYSDGNLVKSQDGYGDITLDQAPNNPHGRLYSFLGWKIGEKLYDPGHTYDLSSPTTAVAQWEFVGFNLTVTNSASAGTLSLYDETTDSPVDDAVFSNGVLSYAGEVGHTYQIRCTVGADNYRMPAGIAGLTNDTFTPVSGQTYNYTYSCPFYWISLPSADGDGNVLSVTSPQTHDAQIEVEGETLPAYAKGRSVTISATTAQESSLVSANLINEGGYSFALYANIDDNSFTVAQVAQNFSVSPTYDWKHYVVSISADTPSAAAFATLTATKAGETPAQSEVAGTEVTFSATMAEGFGFEGFYIGGTKVEDVAESEGVYSFTRTITADTEVVAKAKVSVALNVKPLRNYAGITISGGTDHQTREDGASCFNVTLGESFSYALTVIERNKYFYAWYDSEDDDHLTPIEGFGENKTVTPVAALDIYAYIGNINTSMPVIATFEYANNIGDTTESSFSVNGVVGPQIVTLSYEGGAAPTVVFSAVPENGFLFAGLFTNPNGVGDPVAIGDGGVLTVRYIRTFYVLFKENNHKICEWEGDDKPKTMTWRSKTYEASKPFNPSACRVDALGYPPEKSLALTVDMFSSPNAVAKPTASTTLTNIKNQDARRLPVRRMERYMQIEVKSNSEVDAILVGTSMGGIAL